MGIVARQGIKHSLLKFVGVAVGMLSFLLVYPLSHGTYGHIQFLVGTATLLVPFVGVGCAQALIKFFPEYSQYTDNTASFFTVGLLFQLCTLVLFLAVFFLIKDYIFDYLESIGRPLTKIREHQFKILALGTVLMLCMSAINYISNFKRIVVPSLLYDLGYKLFLPGTVLLVAAGQVAKYDSAMLIIGFYLLVFLMLVIYMRRLSGDSLMPDFSFFNAERRAAILKYSVFSAVSSIGAVLAFRIDAIMITEMLGESMNGLYFNLFVIAMIIDIPNKALMKISAPIISEHWQDNETSKIDELYQKGSNNALIIGLLLFIGIAFNLLDLIQLSSKPEAFLQPLTIFICLGLAKLIDAATGINNQIIIYSNLYIYNFVFIVFLAVSNIVFNIMLIDKYGVVGAAYATLVSLTLFNVAKYIFIAVKWKMSPFSGSTFVILLVGLLTAAIVYVIPHAGNPIISILMKSTMITVIYGGLIYKLKLSDEINQIVVKYSSKILGDGAL